MEDNFIRVTLDSNIIISALLFGGNSKKIIEKLIRREFIAYTSPQLVSELVEVLVQKFRFSEEMVRNLQVQIISLFRIVYPVNLINIARDNDDNMVLETALESNSSIIVTGDKDLLVLGKYKKILIMNPKDFLDLYQ